jgi:putative phage-type endonuclease
MSIGLHLDLEQGSPEWLAMRAKLVTASNFSKAIGTGTGRKTLLYQTAAAILTGEVPESYSNAAMEWGTEQEPHARAMYTLITGADVVESGIVTNSDIPGVGASVDGLVSDDGLVEIKCPNTATHLQYVADGKAPAKYRAQIQGQMWVAARAWCDFMSYDPRIPSVKSIFIKRVMRDDEYIIKTLKPGITQFVADVNLIVENME